ncbi:MAG: hypothetical protein U5L96_20920 [Owenweeksia sp.]|nr:hypothetical protein [Owenweeksia sp.]
MKKWFSLILISLGSAVTAQQPSDSAHFVVGIYGGYYIPDDATAMYYNGSDNNRLVRYMNDRFIKPDIEQALGNS